MLGTLGIADTHKSEAAAVVAQLRAAGKEVWMMTGDHARTAEAIAAGADMILAPADTPAAIRRITDAVLSGELPEERLNESVTRIFLQLLRQG